jgi:hypothetical protein
MSALLGYYIGALFLIGIVLGVFMSRSAAEPRPNALIPISLTTVTVALLAVGIVSGTLVRHVIQVIPVVLALILLLRRSPAGPVAGIPILTFWLGIMIVIWLFLLRIVSVVRGHFTAIEVILTIVMGLACCVGLLATVRRSTVLPVSRRIATAVVFCILQFGAFVLSMQPFANR